MARECNPAKKSLRKEIAVRLQAMSEAERENASRRIAQQVLASPCFRQARTILAFMSLSTEPDTRGIIHQALAQGKQILLPRCLQAPRMEALPWRGEEYLRPGPYGIPEPMPSDSVEQEAAEADLILVPCVAATKDGARLGHGGGYYDWYLQRHPAMKICLCFHTQLVEYIPMNDEDVRMDQVITEQLF